MIKNKLLVNYFYRLLHIHLHRYKTKVTKINYFTLNNYMKSNELILNLIN